MDRGGIERCLNKTNKKGKRVKLPVTKMGAKKKTKDDYRAGKADLYDKICNYIAAARRDGTTLTVHNTSFKKETLTKQ